MESWSKPPRAWFVFGLIEAMKVEVRCDMLMSHWCKICSVHVIGEYAQAWWVRKGRSSMSLPNLWASKVSNHWYMMPSRLGSLTAWRNCVARVCVYDCIYNVHSTPNCICGNCMRMLGVEVGGWHICLARWMISLSIIRMSYCEYGSATWNVCVMEGMLIVLRI